MTRTSTAHTDRIRTAYTEALQYQTSEYVSFAGLREDVGLIPADFDAAIKSMLHDDDVMIVGESNQKALTHAKRSAAVRIGNQDRHYIKIG